MPPHCLVLDAVYRCGGDGVPVFVEAGASTDDELQALLQTVVARLIKMLTRCGLPIGWRWAQRRRGPPRRRHADSETGTNRCAIWRLNRSFWIVWSGRKLFEKLVQLIQGPAFQLIAVSAQMHEGLLSE